jgi:hypothetical protein
VIPHAFSGLAPPPESIMRLIGYIALGWFLLRCAIGRATFRVAMRYGQVGAGLIGVMIAEGELRAKYSLPRRRDRMPVES